MFPDPLNWLMSGVRWLARPGQAGSPQKGRHPRALPAADCGGQITSSRWQQDLGCFIGTKSHVDLVSQLTQTISLDEKLSPGLGAFCGHVNSVQGGCRPSPGAALPHARPRGPALE